MYRGTFKFPVPGQVWMNKRPKNSEKIKRDICGTDSDLIPIAFTLQKQVVPSHTVACPPFRVE